MHLTDYRNHISVEEKAGCFTLIVLWLSVFCVSSSRLQFVIEELPGHTTNSYSVLKTKVKGRIHFGPSQINSRKMLAAKLNSQD